ncbi:MAG: pitrilysin family protein [Actinomycetota bacterium]
MTDLLIPTPGPARTVKAPRVADEKLSNGLRVLVVRKPTIPVIEARMFVPAGGKRNPATSRVMVKTLTSGTSASDATGIARRLQEIGATLDAAMSPDHLQIQGSVLSSQFSAFTALLAEVLTDATFPKTELELERARIVQEVAIVRGQPQTIALEALYRRLYGKHPYGVGLPEPEAVSKVGRAGVASLYNDVLVPKGSFLVLVGDIQPAKAIEVLDAKLKGWKRKAGSGVAVASPPPIALGPTVLVDRPGAVQTNVRLAGPIPQADADDSIALEVANMIFGGYFSSRFLQNLRERNGYTYSPRSSLAHRKLSSFLHVGADVGTDVTVPSLVETHYELGRMISTEVSDDELIGAQRYLTGTHSLQTQTQSGLASALAGVIVFGLGLDYLRTYPSEVEKVTKADVIEASRRYLAPHKLVTLLVGDSEKIASGVELLGDVQIQGR